MTFISSVGTSGSLFLNNEIENSENLLKYISNLRESLFDDYDKVTEKNEDASQLFMKYGSKIEEI